MVLNVTFNNISVISWWSVLLVEETRVPGENHRKSLTNYHIMMYWVHPGMNVIRTHNIGGDRHMIAQVVVNPTTIQSRPPPAVKA